MARRRPSIPKTPEIKRPPRMTAYSAQLLGVSTAKDYGSARTAQDEARRNDDPSTALAIAAAKEGDDSMLLPYQPTPSINPPRPRTRAMGYDPKTETLRVRFRDGKGYEYYDVPPRVWRNIKRVKSPGRAINRTLNFYPYAEADW